MQPESFTINTTLSPDEVRIKLLEVTSLYSTQYRADKIFRGEIKNSSFEIYRMFAGYNSFAAIVKGEIHQYSGGSSSIVEITMGSPNSVRLTVIFVLGAGSILSFFQLLGGIILGNFFLILLSLGGWSLIYLLTTQAFKSERAWAKREIQQLLQ